MAASSMAARATKALTEAARKYLREKAEEEVRRLLRQRTVAPPKARGRRLSASNSWQEWETTLLGTISDREIARRTGRTEFAVRRKRRRQGIPPGGDYVFWT